MYLIFLILSGIDPFFLHAFEQLVTEHGDDSLVFTVAHHGVRLAAPRLTVGEQGTVVSLPCIVQDAFAKVVKYPFLNEK